jgi:2-dehydro-3-deoxyphosphogluconate aldolase/(4S)-4-hydroxy-2-oxoglutarate aldolase
MMDKEHVLSEIEKTGIVAVLRMENTTYFDAVVRALIDGGINAIEITLTTPDALDLIHRFREEKYQDVYLGAGTVLNVTDSENVIKAGAQFIVSPILDLEIIKFANKNKVMVCPGAYSPTEIFRAWESGADVVKVFPATSLGPKFFKDIRGPMPFLKLTPTGGVSVDNAAEFIKAGAAFLGAGTAMLDKKMIKEQDWKALSGLAQQFKKEVDRARSELQK